MKKCTHCKIEKDITLFPKNKSKKDGYSHRCKECNNLACKLYQNQKGSSKRVERNKGYQSKIRDYLINFLNTHPCIDCGNTNILCLDFDHMENKKYDISQMKYLSIRTLEKEIAKCEVRCSNCHRIKTAKERNYYKIWWI